MNGNPRNWYVVDAYGRSYYSGRGFVSRDEALIAARAIPQLLRPFGVFVWRGGELPATGLNGAEGGYQSKPIYRPTQPVPG